MVSLCCRPSGNSFRVSIKEAAWLSETAMTSAVTPGVFFLMVLAAGPPCQAYQCRLPLPGKCSTSNYTIEDGTVCAAAKADCNFTTAEGLCAYRQGCRDSVMTNWTVENGAVKASQRTAGSCSGADFYYSVLESPWLEFTTASCLQFQYKRYVPAALDVFLALHNGSVLTILDRNNNTGYGVLSTYTWTVPPGVGKVKFRAYGGGGTARTTVEVRSVSVSPGHCGSSGKSSDNTEPTTGNCRQLTATTATTRRIVPMASTKNQDSFSRSTLPAAITATTPPTASTNNQASDSQEDDGSRSNTAVVILAVALSVVAAGLAVALVVIAMWRRKILYLTSKREAGTRELGPGLGHRETSAPDVTVTPQNGGPVSPCDYSSLGNLSPRSDYTSLRDIAPNTPAATVVPAAYYNVDNRQTTPCCNTEGTLQGDDGRTSYYNLRGQGSAADVRARDTV